MCDVRASRDKALQDGGITESEHFTLRFIHHWSRATQCGPQRLPVGVHPLPRDPLTAPGPATLGPGASQPQTNLPFDCPLFTLFLHNGNQQNTSKEALNTHKCNALSQQVGWTLYAGSDEGGWPGYWISKIPKPHMTFCPKILKFLPCTSRGAALQARVPIDLGTNKIHPKRP